MAWETRQSGADRFQSKGKTLSELSSAPIEEEESTPAVNHEWVQEEDEEEEEEEGVGAWMRWP